ncbi:MAG: hypothetical protein KDI74_04885 [Gammaproteobacteria bacterium]|nr:hypothetical protein [Gammaproteobacteria bacterium]
MGKIVNMHFAVGQASISIANQCHRLQESIRAVDVVAEGIRTSASDDPAGIYFLMTTLTERMNQQVEELRHSLDHLTD